MDDAFITVGNYHRLDEANFAKSLLEGAGIAAVLVGDTTVGLAWHLSPALGGIQLQVRSEDAELAKEILNPPAAAGRRGAMTAARSGAASAHEADEDADADEGAQDPDLAAPDPQLLAEAEAEEEAAGRLSPREELAERAFRTAIIGLVLPPVQVYATWLIIRVALAKGPMKGRFWVRSFIALVVNVLAWMVFLSIVRSPQGGPVRIGAGCSELPI